MTNQTVLTQIIEFIQVNRVSSTELADAYGKRGLLDERLTAIGLGLRAVGPAFYIAGFLESNWHVHRLMSDAPKGSVAVVEMYPETDRAIIGELVAKFGILYRQLSGIVVLGNVRDTQELQRQAYPIWSFGSSPIGCANVETEFQNAWFEDRSNAIGGGLVVADTTGVVHISPEDVNDELLVRLVELEDQESRWFDAIDRLKMTTFQTVCLRHYEQTRD